ncbi:MULTISPECIES: DUF1329 domain-containing protein [Pseudomonas]|jgi:hypothetical protein|uniref:DUF1329 domain-containing protein n=1 Tax=Pseudomonas TaxID=286 RepID=UPI0002A29A6E|nr:MULTISPECIES: DUF1329 domain-containing protein [Pseudomonas]KSW22409.1 hypothetical protein AOX63_02990 [Pseudomonas sp. ADP]AMO77117.1 hypothetical protein PcP3B5_37040 [Pseudomonas citronellolis]KWR76162.1 hypothetical protein RN02_21020 [Pseudomonas sp. PI1]MBB1604897.1 outer membrane lipoprotein-sorting protein [Pseudomonas sp. UMC76]MBB1641846.1 outer membrane lipoprotein-sorting protein [Pseudomonas sp. UME83]
MNHLIKGTTLGLSLLAGSALAAVSPEQAAELGKRLTPLGAERAGNADGSIPEWTGGLPSNAGSKDGAGFLSNPYAAEKPLFVIDAKNVDKYKDKLSPGQLAMFKRYPDSYRMPVYPSHRSVSLPDAIYNDAKANALHAKMVKDGNGLADFLTAYPFPIPQNAQEVMWNHTTRYRGGSVKRLSVQATPDKDGGFTPVFFQLQFTYRDRLKEFDPGNPGNVLFYYKEAVTAPARLAGDVLLVHETIDQVAEPRQAWIYNAGQRRVRRAPQVAYDGPYPASEGQRVGDNFDLYNGAQDRYTWKLLGKREMYIPYNAFALDAPGKQYTDVIKAGHLNPDLTRYELHRVWVVEANLKPGARHIYAKRVYFVDEDSWQIALADHYDGRGNLWRVAEGHMEPFYDVKVPWLAVETLYDLQNGRYIASGMRNQERNAIEFGVKAVAADFTPTALRNAGVR